MKNSKNIDMRFWQNDFVLGLSPEERYFYMYLITNTMTTQCGIYKFNRKLAELETGYTVDQIENLLEKFQEYGKIIISQSSKEIMLVNWFKHNFKNNKRTKAAINNELRDVKNKDFVKQLYQICLERHIPVEELFVGVLLPVPQKALVENTAKEDPATIEKEEKIEKEFFAAEEEVKEEILLSQKEKDWEEILQRPESSGCDNNKKEDLKTAAALVSKPISFGECQQSNKDTSFPASKKKSRAKKGRKKQKLLLLGEESDFLFGGMELHEAEIVEHNCTEEVEPTEDLTDVDLASLEGWEVVQCWNLQEPIVSCDIS